MRRPTTRGGRTRLGRAAALALLVTGAAVPATAAESAATVPRAWSRAMKAASEALRVRDWTAGLREVRRAWDALSKVGRDGDRGTRTLRALGKLQAGAGDSAGVARTRLRLMTRAARAGGAPQKVNLGLALARGEGVPRDLAAAARWFARAADDGDAVGAFLHGRALMRGAGTPRNRAAGLARLRAAAGAGLVPAMHALARYLADDAAAHPEEALGWAHRAVLAGYPPSLEWLAGRYREGRGVPQSHSRAALLFARAAETGSARAQYEVGRYLVTGAGGAPRLPRTAAAWLRRAADQGHEGAANLLAEIRAERAPGARPAPDPEETRGPAPIRLPGPSQSLRAGGRRPQGAAGPLEVRRQPDLWKGRT